MAKVSGSTGEASFGGTGITVTSWSATIDAPVFDSTDSGSTAGWKENTATGWKSWSGSLEGFLEGSVAGATLGGTEASLILTAASGITFTGNAILNQKTVDTPVSEGTGVVVSYTFVGADSLTEANP